MVPNGPIRFGAIFNLTGAQSGLDTPSADGAVLAAAEINRGGGIAGRPLQLILRDGESDAAVVSETACDLIEREDVVLLLGMSDTDMAFAAAVPAARAGVAFLTSGATSPHLPALVPAYLFMAAFGDNVQAAAAAEFAFNNLKLPSAAILVNRDMEFTILLARYFRQSYQRLGGRVVHEDEYRAGAADFAANIARFTAAGGAPSFLYLCCGPEDCGSAVRQFREAGVTKPILGGDSLDTPLLGKTARELADNVFFTTHAFLLGKEMSPAARKFVTAFNAEYHRVPDNAFAALGYDAVYLAADAVRRADNLSRAAVHAALKGTRDFSGVTGRVSYEKGPFPGKNVVVVGLSRGRPALAATILPSYVPAP